MRTEEEASLDQQAVGRRPGHRRHGLAWSWLRGSLAALAITSSGTVAAEVVRVEGIYTTETQWTGSNSWRYPISPPLPLSLTFELTANPAAPVVDVGGAGVQTHSQQQTQSTQYNAPDRLIVPALQRLQSWQDRPFDSSVFSGYEDPRYNASITTSSRVLEEANFSSWSFRVEQTWQDGVWGPNTGVSEQWETHFEVSLSRPLDPEWGDSWTAGDLSSFLDGFNEAGGRVFVANEATFTRFDGGRVDRTVFLLGEFQMVSVSQPIPEPETYALMAAGLGVLGLVVRRRRKVANG